MSAIAPERYSNFGKTLYITQCYIPETFCVGSVGQYINIVGSAIAILLLLWINIALLLWYYCLKHTCLFKGGYYESGNIQTLFSVCRSSKLV